LIDLHLDVFFGGGQQQVAWILFFGAVYSWLYGIDQRDNMPRKDFV
jgi:hypothetical protein